MNRKTEKTNERRREAGQIVKSIRLVKEVHQRHSWELMKKSRMTSYPYMATTPAYSRRKVKVGGNETRVGGLYRPPTR